jgi:hypothetical protein
VNLFEISTEVVEYGRSHSLTLADQSEKNMLSPDIIVLKADGLIPGHRENLSDSIGKVVVHRLSR